jgi:hypothetical protein
LFKYIVLILGLLLGFSGVVYGQDIVLPEDEIPPTIEKKQVEENSPDISDPDPGYTDPEPHSIDNEIKDLKHKQKLKKIKKAKKMKWINKKKFLLDFHLEFTLDYIENFASMYYSSGSQAPNVNVSSGLQYFLKKRISVGGFSSYRSYSHTDEIDSIIIAGGEGRFYLVSRDDNRIWLSGGSGISKLDFMVYDPYNDTEENFSNYGLYLSCGIGLDFYSGARYSFALKYRRMFYDEFGDITSYIVQVGISFEF